MSEERKEETTLEQRIMKSNLSDDDKIELIQRLKNSFLLPWDRPIEIPCAPNTGNLPKWWENFITIC